MVSISQDRLRIADFLARTQLPRDAEAITDPREFAAEAVVVDGHQDRAAFRESSVESTDLLFRFALDEERLSRRERERVLHPALDCQNGLASNRRNEVLP